MVNFEIAVNRMPFFYLKFFTYAAFLDLSMRFFGGQTVITIIKLCDNINVSPAVTLETELMH